MARKKPAKAQEGGKKVGKGQASEQARFVSESERLKTAPAGSWPVPRHVLMDSKEYRRYTHDGSFLAFVNGDDPDFKGQAQHWADDSNCYVRSTDPEVPLPSCSWPPNFYLASPDQQRYINVEKPVHGGLTWPGRPQPKWPTQDDWLTLLPKPMRNPVKEFLRKRAMEDM